MTEKESTLSTPTDVAWQLAGAISAVFAVEHITTGRGDGQVIHLQGRLLADSKQAYDHMAARFEHYGYTPLLRQQSGHVLVVAIPVIFAAKPGRAYAAILLLALTVLSVLFAGALMQDPDWRGILRHPLSGLPFAVGLLSILIAHELGHYSMSRRLGMVATLPYFIPMPLSPFGTMGAVIRTRTPTRNRRQLLALGASGPIAGLSVAIPILILGLLRSKVQLIPMQPGIQLQMEGNSLLYAVLKFLVFRQLLPHHGYDVFLHPLAFAAWAGLLITGLNLTPAGQLDGGHIAYALFGQNTRWLNRLAVLAATVLGLIWSGWFLFAAILFLLGQRNAQPLDDVTPLTRGQRVLAVCMLGVFALLFTPVPLSILNP